MSLLLPRITLVGVYLGRLPFYSPLFFKSAAANPSVEFLIATDQAPPRPLPANIRFLPITRRTFEILATEKIGRPMRLQSARKLCDYKPAYGRIFCDDLRRADYWGHIDFDVIWGNIPKFVSPALADGAVVISADGKRLSGVFTLYHNNHALRELFREIPDVYARMNAADCFDLDERDFDDVVKRSGFPLILKTFYTRRDISLAELRDFIGSSFVYGSLHRLMHLSASTGRRLPALWRAGELWNMLPLHRQDKVRLLNSMFLHLTSAKVKFSIDFRNDLFLPATI
jgi:hypothetical protein